MTDGTAVRCVGLAGRIFGHKFHFAGNMISQPGRQVCKRCGLVR